MSSLNTDLIQLLDDADTVTLFLQDDACLDDILKWADAAMYRAKKAGKNQIQFHPPAA